MTPSPHSQALAIVGRGRTGMALSRALREAGAVVIGPLGRGEVKAVIAAGTDVTLTDAGRSDSCRRSTEAVILCVPDAEIAAAAREIPEGILVGHCSGATGLGVLAPHEAFSLHPLMTVAGPEASFQGAGAAVAGSTPAALRFARNLADILGLEPVAVAEEDRAAYHVAASIASNFLVTLEVASERLAGSVGVPRRLLVPLVKATVRNWAQSGPEALTGPIVRGDEETIDIQRQAVVERAPELSEMFDALVAATRALAADGGAGGVAGTRSPTPSQLPARRAMTTLRTIAGLRELLSGPRHLAKRIGLVPTMGALHSGHLSLIERARRDCDLVVVSLFVNPTQFNDPGDLSSYPRDEARDAGLAEQAGADVLFAPPVEEVYPDGFGTTVRLSSVSERLEGEHRPGHFDGVATVVLKLFNVVGPDVAYFGQKDAQQVLIIRRLVRDLDLPVEIQACPTVRDADGLALSSRNVLLSPQERRRALSLSAALGAAARAVAEGEPSVPAIRARALAELDRAQVQVDYLELVSPETFEPVEEIRSQVLAVVAARVGQVRLIDNQLLEVRGDTPSLEHAVPRAAPSQTTALKVA